MSTGFTYASGVMTATQLQHRLSDALVMLAPRLREKFRPYYTDLEHGRFLSHDGSHALQWLPGRSVDGRVELRAITPGAAND